MSMLDSINNEITAIKGYVDVWDENTANTLHYKETNLLELKQQILANIEIIDDRVDEASGGVFLSELHARLTVITQHSPTITNASYFNACVDANFEVTILLSQFGYSNNRVDNVIRSSLSSRKEAQLAHQAILHDAEVINQLKATLEEQQEHIETFFDHCFDEDNTESLENKGKEITDAYEKICDENGYSKSIQTAKEESIAFRDEVLEYRDELFEGDSETESVQTHINDLVQELLAQQKRMQSFIQEYISGSSTVTEDKDGNDITTIIKSKKQLVDELHLSFEEHIKNEEGKISDYQSAFEQYETSKKEEIEGLLKAATNASLASSFETLKGEIKTLKEGSEKSFKWALIFIVSAILLPYIPTLNEFMFTSDNLYLNLLKRALLTGPFIWWAFHQSRKANQYFRLEQEYAHKAVVSRSFEGYKSQVLELYKDSVDSNAMLQRLLSGSIDTITKNPADVLDKVQHTSSPIGEMKNTIIKAAESLKGKSES